MRLRLVVLVLATTSMVLTAFLLPLAMLVRTFAADRAIDGAVGEAQSLTVLVAAADPSALALALGQHNASSPDPVTVFLPGTGTVGASAVPSTAVRLAESGRSLTADTAGGIEVLVSVQGLAQGTAVIRVLVPDSVLRHGVDRAWLLLAAVGALLLALGVLVADRLARTLVRPLSALAAASDRLAVGDLAVRAEVSGPREVRRVGTALNGLAERFGDLLAREREYSADLSHRLRTPLTALRIEAESVVDRAERERLAEGVDVLERTVNEIIRDLRRPAREGLWASCDASDVVRERARFWSALADEQQRPMVVTGADGRFAVRIAAEDLGAAVDVLLDNVFAHTPEGTAFAVGLVAGDGGGAVLCVDDAGPGLAGAPERGESGGGSTGLGLDIARRAALASGGSLAVERGPLGGVRIRMELGPALVPAYRARRSRTRSARSRTGRGRPRH
jgi:signal transduction histidine kinase